MIGRLGQALLGWKGYAAAGALGLVVGAGGTWKVRDWMAAEAAQKDRAAERKAANQVVARTQGAAVITQDVGARVETARAAVRVEYRTIIERVPTYVTVEADRQCVVPVGFVQLHDAAASGSSATVPDGAGQSADAPSGVALSTVGETVAANYGSCADTREQVIGWQDWYRQQVAAWDAPD